MNRRVSTVLFDLNETLVYQLRTEKSHIACAYAALSLYQWDITFETFYTAWQNVAGRYEERFATGRQLIRNGRLSAAKSMLQEPSLVEKVREVLVELHLNHSSRITEKVASAFQDSWLSGLVVPDESRVAVESLKDEGYRLGIVTNFQQPDIVFEILSDFRLSCFFDVVTISRIIGCRKPHPAIFWSALNALGLTNIPESVLYVGDNPEDDIEGARLAGLCPVLLDVRNCYNSNIDRTLHIQALSELPDVLGVLE